MKRLTIGELAKQGRVNLGTVRYYERFGLLSKPPRSQSGYRIFPADAVRRIRFIKRAQKLGFSLKEIKELLALRIAGDGTCAEVRVHAKAKIINIEEKIETLQAMKKGLIRVTDACSGSGAISECPILESLSNEENIKI